MQGISDFVRIDCAGGLNKDIRDILEFSDEALVVTNPDLISSTNALKAIKTAEECNSTVIGVVLNKIKEEHNSSETENYLGIPVISEIKYDDYFEKKKPLEGNYTKEEVLLRFRELAKKLM